MPEFVVYRNTDFGYAISYSRDWIRFNAEKRSVSVSSQDLSGMTALTKLATGAILVQMAMLDSPDGLPLKTWLVAPDLDVC